MKVDNILSMVYKDDLVKLESQSVELATVKEITSLLSDGDKEYKSAIALHAKLRSLGSDVLNAYRNAAVKYNQSINGFNDLRSQAKTLGLDLPADVLKKADMAEKSLATAKENLTSIQTANKSIA